MNLMLTMTMKQLLEKKKTLNMPVKEMMDQPKVKAWVYLKEQLKKNQLQQK